MSANADQGELDKFGSLAKRWWDPDGPLKTLHDLNPMRIRHIAERAALAGSRVLDVGCGGGLLAEGLTAEGARVTGIDLAADSIEIAREHAASSGLDIDYRLAAAEEIAGSEAGAYDVVTCLEVLEHVPDPDELIAACAASARPGGSVFFSTINRNPKSFLLAIVAAEYLLGLLPRGTHQYLRLIRPSELASACRAAGLTVNSITGVHFNPLTNAYRFGGNADVNYIVHCTRSGA